jgi:hypothetical protein
VTRIKKVVITAYGDESKLAIVESDLSEPAAEEVQLTVEYTIVSGSDVNMRRGTYPLQKKPPLTPIYLISTISANPATTLLDSPRGSVRRVSGFVQTRSSSRGRIVGLSDK